MKLRVGVIGIGAQWESRHRPALRALSDRFEVRAVCDQVAHRAEQVARDFDAAAVGGFQALARREDVDGLLIMARQWYGVLPIYAACDAGKAVYWASDMDFDAETAQRVKQRVESSGVAFMAEFPRRNAPATLRLKELIATVLGRPRLLFCHTRIPADDPRPLRPGQSRDLGRDQLIELVDWCRYVVGAEPTSVLGISHQASHPPHAPDYQMMSLDFSENGSPGSGATAQLSCGRYMPAAWPEAVGFRPPAALQVACENGIAFADLPSSLTWFDSAGRHMESLESERPVGEMLLAQFHRAVTSLVRNTSNLEDSYRAMAVLAAARESHANGKRVVLRW